MVSMVGGVKPFRDRRLSVRAEADTTRLVVLAAPALMAKLTMAGGASGGGAMISLLSPGKL